MIKSRIFLVSIILTTYMMKSNSQIRLPQIIRDSMVLQRDQKIRIWGCASPGDQVAIDLNGNLSKTMTSPNGAWSIELPAMKYGGPYVMKISGTNQTINLKDILIGDVWFCSGQSNMVHQMNIHDVTYAADIAQANYPEIRQFLIPTVADLNGPNHDLPTGSWKGAVSEDVRPFSAVAFFFARKIYERYHVPIGLINASVGGTPIEAWTSEEGMREFPDILPIIERNKDTTYVNGRNRIAIASRAGYLEKQPSDQGSTGPRSWYDPEFVPRGWRSINIPGYWEDQGIKDLDGVVWYRKEIEVPRSLANKTAKIYLGRIIDADVLYVNGTEIGHKTYQYPQRRYDVPANVLKEGKNVFAIKVTNYQGKGGFVPDKPYFLFKGTDTIDLKGYWSYKVGSVFEPQLPLPSGINAQNQPTALYNGMVAPVINYLIKGILWYQGESNVSHPEKYADQLPALIRDWRAKFDNANAPFVYAQLPNFMEVSYLPVESNWAVFRESQSKALKEQNTAMTVNIDLGEWNDIHPDNKKDVGERMALAAQRIAYGENVISSGPMYQSHKIEGHKMVITFSHVGSGLITDDGEEVGEFAIAGEDKKFVWAKAEIKNDQMIVWSEQVHAPKYVRYAWADNPVNPNLYNQEGLPASPFRTD